MARFTAVPDTNWYFKKWTFVNSSNPSSPIVNDFTSNPLSIGNWDATKMTLNCLFLQKTPVIFTQRERIQGIQPPLPESLKGQKMGYITSATYPGSNPIYHGNEFYPNTGEQIQLSTRDLYYTDSRGFTFRYPIERISLWDCTHNDSNIGYYFTKDECITACQFQYGPQEYYYGQVPA